MSDWSRIARAGDTGFTILRPFILDDPAAGEAKRLFYPNTCCDPAADFGYIFILI